MCHDGDMTETTDSCDLCDGPLPADPEDAYIITEPMPARLGCGCHLT